ncbi:MAG: peptide-methionine (S)-S-oxide reductase MsrA [Gemmatimonadetes bacterium]|nr:peptide-methionine (S)-S-oxide reductase MsrA [Gemmatimonadota bacterium]
MSDGKQVDVATLGGGCFWCLEAVFERVEGVLTVSSGYAGGKRPNPTYEQVCSGATGHAEVVQVRFDPSVIGYRDILEIFFAIHDPTTLDRQGADVGTQYRSTVFYETEEQRDAAHGMIGQLDEEGIWDAPIVTEVEPLEAFWPAEDYHRDYFRRNLTQPYCQVVVAPKVAKFRQRFAHRLRADG